MNELSDKSNPSEAEQPAGSLALANGDQGGNSGGSELLKMVAVSGLVSLAVAVGTVAGVYALGLGKARVATVDIAGVVELEQMRMTALVMKPETSEEERMRAMTRVKGFGAMLGQAIEEVQGSCGCVILASNAVIGSNHEDLTESVKAKLGLQGIDLASARAGAEQALNKRLPSSDEIQRSVKGTLKP